MIKKLRFLSCLTIYLLGASCILQADPVLLGNKGLASQKLDKDAIKAVLLGKKTTLGSDRVVIVIVRKSESQDAFLKTVGMTTDQLQTHWRRLFMTGGGTAPKTAETEAEALKLVAETAGAIAVADQANAGDLPVISTK